MYWFVMRNLNFQITKVRYLEFGTQLCDFTELEPDSTKQRFL